MNFPKINVEDVKKSSQNFQKMYARNIESDFCNEFLHFIQFVRQFPVLKIEHPTTNITACKLYNFIVRNELIKTFPNVEIAFHIY